MDANRVLHSPTHKCVRMRSSSDVPGWSVWMAASQSIVGYPRNRNSLPNVCWISTVFLITGDSGVSLELLEFTPNLGGSLTQNLLVPQEF